MENILAGAERVSVLLEKIINLVVSVLLSALFICVVIGVFSRNINIPVVWLGELGTFSCIWSIFLGMALAYRHDLFPSVEVLNFFLSKKRSRCFPYCMTSSCSFFT